MHIKPYVVLGLAAACASVSLGVLVTQVNPYTSADIVLALFWASFFLAAWGVVATAGSLIGLRLGYAVIAGLIWAIAILSSAFLRHAGRGGWGLSAIVLGATILLSFLLWWRMHKKRS